MDNKRGIATDRGIPWRLPGDTAYFRDCTQHGLIVMGWVTYSEFASPLNGRENYVITSRGDTLRSGFSAVDDIDEFLADHGGEEVWVIGGAAVFAMTIDRAEELFITQVLADFNCSKFFPEYAANFSIVERSADHTENDATYRFEQWKRSEQTESTNASSP
jgi:dihydrofolate reductase